MHAPANLLAILSWLSVAGCSSARPDDYQKWLRIAENQRAAENLQRYLDGQGVGDVFPLRQLLRSDTQWRKCNTDAYAAPPRALWPHIVPTLKVIRSDILPITGPLEAQSVFRGPDLNRCIKGASHSFHLRFRAIDMRPTGTIARAQLVDALCNMHARKGKAFNIGLGIYRGTRFHIDTAGYRRWGHDHTAATSPCTSFVAPQRISR